MVYITVFGGLVLAGALLATLKNVRKSDNLSALNLR
jgi:acyl-CoA thioesterase